MLTSTSGLSLMLMLPSGYSFIAVLCLSKQIEQRDLLLFIHRQSMKWLPRVPRAVGPAAQSLFRGCGRVGVAGCAALHVHNTALHR
jgi:hypothetical protein